MYSNRLFWMRASRNSIVFLPFVSLLQASRKHSDHCTIVVLNSLYCYIEIPALQLQQCSSSRNFVSNAQTFDLSNFRSVQRIVLCRPFIVLLKSESLVLSKMSIFWRPFSWTQCLQQSLLCCAAHLLNDLWDSSFYLLLAIEVESIFQRLLHPPLASKWYLHCSLLFLEEQGVFCKLHLWTYNLTAIILNHSKTNHRQI